MQKGSDLQGQGDNQPSGNKVGADTSSADKARNFEHLREEEEESGSESGSESYLEGAPSGVNLPNEQEPAQSASSDSTAKPRLMNFWNSSEADNSLRILVLAMGPCLIPC